MAYQYTDYFMIEEVLDDMISQNYLRRLELYNTIEYFITPFGEETIKICDQDLSFTIKNDIKEYLEKNSFEINQKNSLTAVKYKQGEDTYVQLKAIDATTTLLDIKIACVSDEQAKRYCENWREASTRIYSSLIKALEQPKE